MRKLVILWHIALLPVLAYSQSCGLSDTILLSTNSEQFIDLNITDFFNNNLADPAQGLCEIELKFVHQLSENLEVWLTSPAGQTIQLIGPNTDDQFAFTFSAGWNISFIPSGETAVPDPGHPAHWDNNQPNNFVVGGIYTGSYYPYIGSLENFNTGPVNGIWRFRVRNNPSSYSGAFLFIRLVFCDSRGVDCCFAKAGQLTAPDLVTCQGDTSLVFDPSVVIAGPPADTAEFAYTYIYSRADTIIGYDTLADLSDYPAGNYQICGLSYRKSQVDSLPIAWTVDSLRTNLESFTPKFCGQLTGSCIEVEIVPPPDTTILDRAICDGDSFSIGDSTWTTAGQFQIPLQSFAGCDSIVRVNLMVYPIPVTQIDTVICAGSAYAAGTSTYTVSGTYRDTLQAFTGCDSIVISNLTVRDPIAAVFDTTVCAGQTVIFGGQPFSAAGQYQVVIPSTEGCDSTITVNLTVIDVQAVIAAPDILTCANPEIQLNGSGSSPAGQISFEWQDSGGATLGAGPVLAVSDPGSYQLLVTRTVDNTVCSDRDTATVAVNQVVPLADPGSPDTLTCTRTQISLGGPGTSTGPDITYNWTSPTGHFAGPDNVAEPLVDQPGEYTLIVTDLQNGCRDTAAVAISIDTIHPAINPIDHFTINCLVASDTLFGAATAAGPLEYLWSGPCLVSAPANDRVIVNCAGQYVFQATNTLNGCSTQAQVMVDEDLAVPAAQVSSPDPLLTCSHQVVTLDGSGSVPGSRIRFDWADPGSNPIGQTPVINVSQAGNYLLTVTDTINGCTGAATINVTIDTLAPQALAGPDQTINCQVTEVSIGANQNPSPEWVFSWTILEGRLTGPANQPVTTTDTSGYFQLIVTDQSNDCRDTALVRVFADLEKPFANAGSDETINCGTDVIILDGSQSNFPAGSAIAWEGPCLMNDPEELVNSADCPGLFILTVTNPDNFCTDRDTAEIFLNPAAPYVVLSSDTAVISCTDGMALLDASGSSAGFYDWYFNGVSQGVNSKTFTVSEPGTYIFEAANGDRTCVDQDSMVVVMDCLPVINIPTPDSIICGREVVAIAANVVPQGPEYIYSWSGPDESCIVSGQGTATIQASCSGAYSVTVTNPAVGLEAQSVVTLLADLNVPFAEAGPPDTINCVQSQATLDGSNSSSGPNFIYRWTDGITGNLVGENLMETVFTPGTYFLEVIDTVNQCSSSDFVQILKSDTPPTVNFGSSVFPCDRDTFGLESFISPPSDFYAYSWSGPGIVSGADGPTAQVDALGEYTLLVVNTQNLCQSAGSVTVTDQICAPCLDVAVPDTLNCLTNSVALQAAFCYPCVDCQITWQTDTGQLEGPVDGLSATATAPGAYRITATDTLGFSTTVEITVIRNADLPKVMAGPDRRLTCDSTQVTLGALTTATGPNLIYEWTSEGNSAITIQADPRFARVGSEDTYILKVSNPGTGCFATDTVLVSRDTTPPVAEAGPAFTLTCTQQQVILNGAGSSTSNVLYQWSGPASSACLTGPNTLNPIARCPATYFLTVTNLSNGCAATDSTVVNPAPDLPQIVPFPDTILTCSNPEITLLGSVPGPTGYSFGWVMEDQNGNPVAGSETQEMDRLVNAPGRYRFTVTDQSSNCQNQFTVLVGNDQTPPQVDAGPNATLDCTIGSLSLTGTVAPASGNYTVSWTSPEGFPIDNPASLTPLVHQPGKYFLQIDNMDNGCSAQDFVQIFRDLNAPVISAGLDTSLSCLITQIRLSGSQQTMSGQAMITWIASDGGNIVSGGNSLNPLINAPGVYQLSVKDPVNNCTVMAQVMVSANNAPPQADIAGLDTLTLDCTRDTIVLDAGNSITDTGAPAAFKWSVHGEGRLFPDLTASSVMTDAAGNYRLIVTDSGNGCMDTLAFNITADFELPTLAYQPIIPLTCLRQETQLAIAGSVPGNFSLTWFDPAGLVLGEETPMVATTTGGNHRLIIENTTNGCTNELVLTVPTDTMPPIVRIATPDFLDCDMPVVDLDGYNSSKGIRYIYNWSTPDGRVVAGQDQLIARADLPGTYTLSIADTLNGCTASANVAVEALAFPVQNAEVEVIPPGCGNQGGGGIQVVAVSGGTGPYRYNLDGGILQTEPGFGPLAPGAYLLGVTDINQCTWDTLIVVPEAEPIQADLGPDVIILLGDSTRLSVQHTAADPDTIIWSPAPFAATGSPDEIVVKPLETTIYSVTVIDRNGCKATDRIIVQVDRRPAVYIPNAFSPDNKGDNDRFTVYGGSGLAKINVLRIYERWGNMVFERKDFPPNDPALGWDGTLNGRVLNAAVFVYYLEVAFSDGKTAVYTGDLTLMR